MTRVLLVEDEESFSDPLSYLLKAEGFDVAVVATGPEALAEYDRGGGQRLELRPAAEHGPDPRDELARGVRLRDVVVGA